MKIAIAVHTALSHLDKRNMYLRMLFIDYSSNFNTTLPFKIITKLGALGLNPALCN
jgi:gmma-aminobutyric acid receptor subunit gamma/cGMP-dependent protein kinase 2